MREPVAAIRVASTPEALDRADWPAGATVLRIAPDETLLLDVLDTSAPEPDAIVFPDTGWVRFVLTPAAGQLMMRREAAWPAPAHGLGQGMVAGVPVKLVVHDHQWWFVVLAVVADEFEARVEAVVS